jgi:hypothetical protein
MPLGSPNCGVLNMLKKASDAAVFGSVLKLRCQIFVRLGPVY